MTWVAVGVGVVGAAGSLYSGAQGSKASKRAADQQAASAEQGRAIAGQSMDMARGDFAPYAGAGREGLNMLMAGIGDGQNGDLTRRFSMADYQADPGYEFRRTEGMRGLEGSAAARGGLMSGGALKSLDRYNSGQASQEYGNAFNRYNMEQGNRYNRLMGAVGIGQFGAGGMANAATRYGDQAVGLNTALGNAQSAGTMGSANAWGGAMNGALNAGMTGAMMYGMNQKPAQQPGYQGGNMANNQLFQNSYGWGGDTN